MGTDLHEYGCIAAALGRGYIQTDRNLELDDAGRICYLKGSQFRPKNWFGFSMDAREIDLREAQIPAFIEGISGFSTRESFGRWTDADIARIIFATPLPPALDVEIVMMPFEPNLNQPILVVAGTDARILHATVSGMHRYRIQFSCKLPGRMIEFFIPHALSPLHLFQGALPDLRRLGIGVQSVTVRTNAAAAFSQEQ